MATDTSAYIDIEKLTAPDFSPYQYANISVLSTNNASDPSTDLTTPLSRALFDLQEIDSNIHNLTSRSALDILTYTSTQNEAASRILDRVEEDRSRINASYARLEKEILGQYEKASLAKLHAERSQQLLKLGRNVQRVLALARQFEGAVADANLNPSQTATTSSTPTQRSSILREDHRAILRASHVILSFRTLLSSSDPIMVDLAKINVVRQIRGRVFEDGEAKVLDYARRVIREFTINSITTPSAGSNVNGSTFKEAEENKAKFTSACHVLFLLSPLTLGENGRMEKAAFEPEYMLRALQGYLQTAVTSSSAGIARALLQIPTLDRSLVEVSARCQSIIALEALLRTIPPPHHPLLDDEKPEKQERGRNIVDSRISGAGELDEEFSNSDEELEEEDDSNLLSLLLESLDTSNLASYFWRSLASQLSNRVQEVLNRGGMAARTLRGSREEVKSQVRDCVMRGSKMPASLLNQGKNGGKFEQAAGNNWEREAAVMVGSVIGPLSR